MGCIGVLRPFSGDLERLRIMKYRFATDTGGTFTDLLVEEIGGPLTMYKAATTPSDPVKGVLDALSLAARDRGLSLTQLLSDGDIFMHGTTHAINAIITGRTARTALLTTQGHPDILTIREGGRSQPFNYSVPYPEPYVPRHLTFEVPERVTFSGGIHTPLDEASLRRTLMALKEAQVEAIAVCYLWSVVNPAHELRTAELIAEVLPGTPYTLSHQINPSIREYRRAAAASMDASLKPLMGRYLGSLTERLADAGFAGRVLVLTSQGGVLDAEPLSRQPIHAINSGPSMAPIAGRHFAQQEGFNEDVIIADTGGTTYDVSLVRGGVIPWSAETWIGPRFSGHMTGFPSVDVTSVGAGGGSIASVDEGGMLHVGPASAGAVPGPVCYGKGGTLPTFTDACLALGFLDPGLFLGGAQILDRNLSVKAIEEHVAGPLGQSVEEAAGSVVALITENMVQAINDITINQGVDPAAAVLIGGGGAAGFNSVWIARRLGCKTVILPGLSAALSAAGALISDLTADYRRTFYTRSDRFDFEGVRAVLSELLVQCASFQKGPGEKAVSHMVSLSVEARYEGQVWEVEIPLRQGGIGSQAELDRFLADFHELHERVYAVQDPRSVVECVGWIARIRSALRPDPQLGTLREASGRPDYPPSRLVHFPDTGPEEAALYHSDLLEIGVVLDGPAIVESAFSTAVLPRGCRFHKSEHGNLVVQV